MSNEVTKKINLCLVGINGNAYALMGAFSRQARKEGWNQEEIEAVMKECRNGDYDNLLRVLMSHCENPLGGDDEDDDDEAEEDQQ